MCTYDRISQWNRDYADLDAEDRELAFNTAGDAVRSSLAGEWWADENGLRFAGACRAGHTDIADLRASAVTLSVAIPDGLATEGDGEDCLDDNPYWPCKAACENAADDSLIDHLYAHAEKLEQDRLAPAD